MAGIVTAAQGPSLALIVTLGAVHLAPQLALPELVFPILILGIAYLALIALSVALLVFGVRCALHPSPARLRRCVVLQPLALCPVAAYGLGSRDAPILLAWLVGALTIFAGEHGARTRKP